MSALSPQTPAETSIAYRDNRERWTIGTYTGEHEPGLNGYHCYQLRNGDRLVWVIAGTVID